MSRIKIKISFTLYSTSIKGGNSPGLYGSDTVDTSWVIRAYAAFLYVTTIVSLKETQVTHL